MTGLLSCLSLSHAKIISGKITLHEHSAMVWLPREELHTLDWAEADMPVIEEYQGQFDCKRGRWVS